MIVFCKSPVPCVVTWVREKMSCAQQSDDRRRQRTTKTYLGPQVGRHPDEIFKRHCTIFRARDSRRVDLKGRRHGRDHGGSVRDAANDVGLVFASVFRRVHAVEFLKRVKNEMDGARCVIHVECCKLDRRGCVDGVRSFARAVSSKGHCNVDRCVRVVGACGL